MTLPNGYTTRVNGDLPNDNGNGSYTTDTRDSTSRPKFIYRTAIVHSSSPTEVEIIPDALLAVSDFGTILWVEDITSSSQQTVDDVLRSKDAVGVEVVELQEGFICPGLIDTHTHAPQHPNVGIGSDKQLLDWLDDITFPTEAKYKDVVFARAVYGEVVRRTLGAGTTTSCYYATIHDESSRVLADLCFEQGQRAFIGKCNMDRSSPSTYVESTESSLESTQSFIDHFDSYPPPLSSSVSSSSPKITADSHSSPPPPLVQPIITPRFAISCTPELLQGLGDLSRTRTPSYAVQTHMSENPREISTVKDMFKDCGCGESYAGVYEKYGLLSEGTILAHCVHLDEREREILKRTGAGVSHCPSSNTFLNSGMARVRDMLDDGIKVGLGTDCSGGPSISILNAIRSASFVSKAISFSDTSYAPFSTAELFYLATVGGAKLCRLENTIGTLEQGKEFDALWVRPGFGPNLWDLSKVTGDTGGSGTATISREQQREKSVQEIKMLWEQWIWTGDDRDLGAVWVRGRKVSGTD